MAKLFQNPLFGGKQESISKAVNDNLEGKYLAKCTKTGQHFIIEAKMVNGELCAVNFQDVTDEKAEEIKQKGCGSWPKMDSAMNLRACRWCHGRHVSGCNCMQTKGFCPSKGQYAFQCLYCKNLQPAVGSGVTDLRNLKLSVTTKHYDDIGAILTEMGLSYKSFNQTGFDRSKCDVLFLNCGTSDAIDPNALREFVRSGGCVYASDFADEFLTKAFSENTFKAERKGSAGKYPAKVEDPELKKVIGDQIDVTMDLGSWAVIKNHKGTSLIRQRAGLLNEQPLMINFKYGEGEVFYTSFHNHAQASEREKNVLKVMLLRQIGSITHQPIDEMIDLLGLNIKR